MRSEVRYRRAALTLLMSTSVRRLSLGSPLTSRSMLSGLMIAGLMNRKKIQPPIACMANRIAYQIGLYTPRE